MGFTSVNFKHLTLFNSAASSEFLEFFQKSEEDLIAKQDLRKPSQTIAPSSSWCKRINWFRLRGVDPDGIATQRDTVLNFAADVGTAIHERTQRILKEYLKDDWVCVEDYLTQNNIQNYNLDPSENGLETRIEWLDTPMRMSVDGIIRFNKKIYLLEIKTIEYSTFQELTDPKPFHVEQVKQYCAKLHINTVLFMYIDRTYGNIKVYECTFNDADLDTVRRDLDELVLYANAGIAPERPSDKSRCNSNWCKYFEKCKSWG